MNKYSKRALKTTATVGMSLAMVLSAAAPVMAAETFVEPAVVCTLANTDKACAGYLYDVSKAIEKITLDELTVESTATIGVTEDAKIIASLIANKDNLLKNTSGSDYTMIRGWFDVIDVIAADDLGTSSSKGMFSTDYFTVAHTDATAADTAAATGGLVNYYNTQLSPSGDWEDATAMDTSANATAAVKAFEKMTGWMADGFYDRLDERLAERFDATYDLLEERTADYVTSDEAVTREFVAAWSIVLEADMNGTEGVTISFGKGTEASDLEEATGLGADPTTIDLGSKAAIKARIDAIKAAPNYYRVKEDDGVLDIIEQYNELLGNITDLKDLLKDDSYKAFTSTKVKTNTTTDATLKAFLKGTTLVADKDAAEALGKTLTAEQLEILVALKEDVLDYAYNFETKKVGSYYVDKSDFVSGFTGTSTVNNDLGSAKNLMFALVDNKEGLFGIDVVIAQAQKGVDAYAAVTTDIEKLTPANIKASDKAKLVAAEDALYELEANGEFADNLTKAQQRELRRITTKIDNLREAFDNLGTTTATGWYDMGAGNWGFNNEDGTPATKWVAAGSNWYYVKGGNMLRNAWIAENASGARWYYVNDKGVMVTNAVVDGYTIDANGIWTK